MQFDWHVATGFCVTGQALRVVDLNLNNVRLVLRVPKQVPVHF